MEKKKPVGPKNDKYFPKTYTFDVTKCDKIFDLLVADGPILVPKILKTPPSQQRKKRGFCKFHNFLGHRTSHCVLFKDLAQKALSEERLKFGDKSKPQMQIDVDPLQVSDTMYAELVYCMMVDVVVDDVENLTVKANTGVVDCQVVKATKGPKLANNVIYESRFSEKMKVVYPMEEEELIDFLHHCKLNKYEVMLCPTCSSVFDKKATKGLDNYKPQSKKKEKMVC